MADLPSDFSGTKMFSWGLDKITRLLSFQCSDFPRNRARQLLTPLAVSRYAVDWNLTLLRECVLTPSCDSAWALPVCLLELSLSLWSWEWKCLLSGSQWYFEGPTEWEPDRNVGGPWAGLQVHWAKIQLPEAKQSLIMAHQSAANIWLSERVGPKPAKAKLWEKIFNEVWELPGGPMVRTPSFLAQHPHPTPNINEVKRYHWKK